MAGCWSIGRTRTHEFFKCFEYDVFIPDFLRALQCLICISSDLNIAPFSLDLNFIISILVLSYSSVTTSDQLPTLIKPIAWKGELSLIDTMFRLMLSPTLFYSNLVVEDVFVFVCLVSPSWSVINCSSLSTTLSSSGSSSSRELLLTCLMLQPVIWWVHFIKEPFWIKSVIYLNSEAHRQWNHHRFWSWCSDDAPPSKDNTFIRFCKVFKQNSRESNTVGDRG